MSTFLFVGVDVGKLSHVAAFLSPELLRARHKHTNMPTLSFPQTRVGITALLNAIELRGGIAHAAILLEQTGHYHRSLLETLQTAGLQVYTIAIHQRHTGDKSDKRDAQRLANLLYSQLALHVQVDDPTQQIRELLPPTPVAAEVAPLVRLHYEKTQDCTRLSNKLTALCDELFPELQSVIKPNAPFALDLRAQYPTPGLVAEAALSDLQALRRKSRPTNGQLSELQKLAASSVGVTDAARLRGLLLEQRQLIAELRLVTEQLTEVDTLIHQAISTSREGQILTSLPALGDIDAAVFLSVIGNIRNFEKASQLRRLLGWSPVETQTGTSRDSRRQASTGSRLGKRHLFLLAARSARLEPWRAFYMRLVEKKCSYDARLKRHVGKRKVLGRLCGTLAGVIFTLLKADATLVDATPPGSEPPLPQLYDPAIHQAHRRGTRRHAQSA